VTASGPNKRADENRGTRAESGGPVEAHGPEHAEIPSIPVEIPITLGQFVKLAGLASTGGEAKMLVAEGRVAVNDVVDTRRGRKLGNADVVDVDGRRAIVASSEGAGATSTAVDGTSGDRERFARGDS